MKNSELTYKEIYGQPQSFQAINNTLGDIYKVLDQVFAEEYDELIFTGCGTSLYLAQAAAHAFASCTKIPAKGMCCSCLLYTSTGDAMHLQEKPQSLTILHSSGCTRT